MGQPTWLHKLPLVGGSGGMPLQKIFAKWMLRGEFSCIPNFSVALYNYNSSTNAHMGESLPIELRTAKIILILLQIQRERA